MGLILRFRQKASSHRPVPPVFRSKQAVPPELMPFLDAVADLLVADFTRHEREKKYVQQWLAQRRTGMAC
jgi:hypothetical protein